MNLPSASNADLAASLALRAPHMEFQLRLHAAKRAYFSRAFEDALRADAQNKKQEPLNRIAVEILPNAAARVRCFDGRGALVDRNIEATSLRDVVMQLNRDVLKPIGLKGLSFEDGKRRVEKLYEAMQQTPTMQNGIIIGR